MMDTKIFCDKCTKQIKEDYWHIQRVVKTERLYKKASFELCEKCIKRFLNSIIKV